MLTRRRGAVGALLALLALAAIAVLAVSFIDGGGGSARPEPARNPPQRTVEGNSGARAGRSAAARSSDAGPKATAASALGQLIVARFEGAQPSHAFLHRIRRGQIGGVILFADNLSGGVATIRALTRELQVAARRGGNPPLLIMTDQEGGAVRRVPGPPSLAPSEMATAAIAFQQGQAAGAFLRSVGINVDLAPVADVEAAPHSFLGARAFGSSPVVVAGRACAFAAGLAREGVGYTLKHFPGLGEATTSTDDGPVSIQASAAALRADYLAYARCANSPLAMVMVSSATYPSLTGPLPAVTSPLTYQRELRLAGAGIRVPTISDDLQAPALANQPAPARRAIQAGLDMAMYARTERGSAEAYQVLRQDVGDGQLSARRLGEAARAIRRLKAAIAGG